VHVNVQMFAAYAICTANGRTVHTRITSAGHHVYCFASIQCIYTASHVRLSLPCGIRHRFHAMYICAPLRCTASLSCDVLHVALSCSCESCTDSTACITVYLLVRPVVCDVRCVYFIRIQGERHTRLLQVNDVGIALLMHAVIRY
jgi:hypothetical protein